jgi:hypothetical protein
MALVAGRGEFYQAAQEITKLSVGRGATVATFIQWQDALAWFAGQSGKDASPAIEESETESPVAIPCPRDVVVPYALRERIETAGIELNGLDCPLRLDFAAWHPSMPDIAELTVTTERAGTALRATAAVRVSRLDDEDYVVSAVVSAITSVFARAELEPVR